MSSVPTRNSPDKPDLRPSFRKPSNDSAHRKYRHHSPADVSDSSSSGGSPRREQSIIQLNSLENRNKVSDDRARKHHGKESERDPGRHSSRGSDSLRYSDNYRSSRDYQNNDEGGGYRRHSDDEDRNSVRYSVRELRSIRSERERGNSFERSKESRNADRYHTTDKFENSGHRSRGKDIEVKASADLRYNEKESTRAVSGSRKISSIRDNKRADEWEQPRERDDRDERRIYYRSPSDYKKESAHTPEDSRGHAKDSVIGMGSDSYRLKESQRKELDEHDYHARKRRYNDRDTRKCEDKYSRDPDENRKKESASFPVFQVREERSESHVDKNSNAAEELSSSSKKSKLGQSVTLNMAEGKPSSSAKQVKEATEKFTVGPPVSNISINESGQDLNAAKVAAIQAAELVNRNLVGTGFMSTDQKKKLLWGSKKSSLDESGTRWDLQLFTDRERQEKFNKLMGVKGDGIPPERKPDEKDVEKQKELQLDLEKQYTAGLRRRDGRTVGLGL